MFHHCAHTHIYAIAFRAVSSFRSSFFPRTANGVVETACVCIFPPLFALARAIKEAHLQWAVFQHRARYDVARDQESRTWQEEEEEKKKIPSYYRFRHYLCRL